MFDENYGQPIVYGNNNASVLKSELVRKNVVTRSDLMKLYQPPIKKSSLLENNPFHNKSLVGSYGQEISPTRSTRIPRSGAKQDKNRDRSLARRRASKTPILGLGRPNQQLSSMHATA
jgi:hypothetical protein